LSYAGRDASANYFKPFRRLYRCRNWVGNRYVMGAAKDKQLRVTEYQRVALNTGFAKLPHYFAFDAFQL
jgi:hypothetical protein